MAGGLGGEKPVELFEPGAAEARHRQIGGAVARPVGNGRQGANPGAELEAAQEADETGEVAARAGAAGEIELAGLGLVPVPGDGELDGANADGFQPDQLALPELAGIEVVGELDGLDDGGLGCGRRGHGHGGGQRHEQGGEAHQNFLAFRRR